MYAYNKGNIIITNIIRLSEYSHMKVLKLLKQVGKYPNFIIDLSSFVYYRQRC